MSWFSSVLSTGGTSISSSHTFTCATTVIGAECPSVIRSVTVPDHEVVQTNTSSPSSFIETSQTSEVTWVIVNWSPSTSVAKTLTGRIIWAQKSTFQKLYPVGSGTSLTLSISKVRYAWYFLPSTSYEIFVVSVPCWLANGV